jgi:8-oxo-dGTP pyrophosphatase MutT (NUDIX family)
MGSRDNPHAGGNGRVNEMDRVASRLRAALLASLPGPSAHRIALPEGFNMADIPRPDRYRPAAVLIALYRDAANEKTLFPLIRRPASLAHHGGQISLPGGEMDPGEDPVACALREAHEEVGILPEQVEILGGLTPIEIPVSGYRVDSIVGFLRTAPRYVLQESEVRGILLADPDLLAAEGPREVLSFERNGRTLRFPAWNVESEKVWGATAQILGEFIEIWKRA